MRVQRVLLSCAAVMVAQALAQAQRAGTVEMEIKKPSPLAPAIANGKLVAKQVEGAKGVQFLEVHNSGSLPVTAYAIRFVAPVPPSVLLVAGAVSVKVAGQFTGIMYPPVGAILAPEGLQVDCLDQVPLEREIPPGGSQRILQFTSPPQNAPQFETFAILYGTDASEGDAKAIEQTIGSRCRRLRAIPSVRQFLEGGALAKIDAKSLDKKFHDFEASQRRSGSDMDLRGVLQGVRRTISTLPKKATPNDAQGAVKTFLDGLETALKESKPQQ